MATESEKRYGSIEEIKRASIPNPLPKEQQEERERREAEPSETPWAPLENTRPHYTKVER